MKALVLSYVNSKGQLEVYRCTTVYGFRYKGETDTPEYESRSQMRVAVQLDHPRPNMFFQFGKGSNYTKLSNDDSSRNGNVGFRYYKDGFESRETEWTVAEAISKFGDLILKPPIDGLTITVE